MKPLTEEQIKIRAWAEEMSGNEKHWYDVLKRKPTAEEEK